jgi:hypothetical protein
MTNMARHLKIGVSWDNDENSDHMYHTKHMGGW